MVPADSYLVESGLFVCSLKQLYDSYTDLTPLWTDML